MPDKLAGREGIPLRVRKSDVRFESFNKSAGNLESLLADKSIVDKVFDNLPDPSGGIV